MLKTLIFYSILFCISSTCLFSELKVNLGPDFKACHATTIVLKAEISGEPGPYSYKWRTIKHPGYNFSTDSVTSIYIYENTTIFLTVSTSQGSQASDSVNIYSIDQWLTVPFLSQSGNMINCNKPVKLSASGDFVEYLWNDDQKGIVRTIWEPGNYKVKGLSRNGCWSGWSEAKYIILEKYSDSLKITRSGSVESIGDTFILEVKYEISDKNLKCLPLNVTTYLEQEGTNILPISDTLKDLVVDIQGNPRKFTGYELHHIITGPSQVFRHKFMHVLGNFFYGKIFHLVTKGLIDFIKDGNANGSVEVRTTCFNKLRNQLYNKTIMLNIYPNPVSRILNYSVKLSDSSTVKLILLDLNGRQFLITELKSVQEGIINDSVDLSGFEAGRYLIVLYSGNDFTSTVLEIVR